MTRKTLLLLTLVCSAHCFSGYDSRGGDAFTVHRGEFRNDIILTGELDAASGATISVPKLPSWQTAIKWLAVDGSEVKAGERVVELDNSTFANDLDEKRSAETQAVQELAQKEGEWSADLRQKELEVDKKRGEYDKAAIDAAMPKEIIPARDYQDRQTKLGRAKTELAKARALLAAKQSAVAADRANIQLRIGRAHRELSTAEEAIQSLVLRAPRDGIVVVKDFPWGGETRKFQSGDTTFVGMTIATIPELESLQVKVALPDVDDGRVAIGMPAVTTLDGYPELHFAGKVVTVSAVAKETRAESLRRVFNVIVALDRIDPLRMRPGLSARVEIRRGTAHRALLVPRGALAVTARGAQARLEDGSLVPVTLGACNAQECVVASGLREGTRLKGAL